MVNLSNGVNELIIHTDLDEMTIVRVPQGWMIGKDFRLRVSAILIVTADGAEISFELPEPETISFAYSEINLDGRSGYRLAFWLKVRFPQDQRMPKTILDPEIKKVASLEFLKADGSGEAHDSGLLIELVTPEVVVLESQSHLIVAHEVTNDCSDRSHLVSMANQARDATGRQNPNVLADRGYHKGEEIFERERQGITALVPKPLTLTAGPRAASTSGISSTSPSATSIATSVEHGMRLHRYWSSVCPRCPIKGQCTPSDYRRITRWEHESVLDAMQDRLDRMPEASRLRRQTVEHPYATLKAWIGTTHFLTKTLPKVSTE